MVDVSGPAHPAWVSTDFTLADLLASFELPFASCSEVEVDCLPSAHGGILGAQMLGQAVSACEVSCRGKVVVKLAMTFVRPSSCAIPVRVVLRPRANGRRFAFIEVCFEQGGQVVAHGEALLGPSADDDTSAAHANVVAAGSPVRRALWPWDVLAPADDRNGADLWARLAVSDLSGRASRSVLAFATESLTVPLVIDQHGLRERGGDIRQAVLSHAITFASGFDARRWHLHRPEIVGRQGSVVTGRGVVIDSWGRPVATTETVASIDL